MTIAPAPRRGLFLCELFRTFAAGFSLHAAIFGAFPRVLRIPPFLCVLLRPFLSNFFRCLAFFFLLALFCSFQPFLMAFYGSFAAFFCAVFCFVCRPAGQDHHGQPEPEAGRDRAALFFYVRFCRVLGISQHPQSRTNRGRSGTRPAPMFVYAFPVFSCAFTVPFLCRHGCP